MHRHSRIYLSRSHIAITLFFVAIPFIFLLFFSRIAHIQTVFLFESIFVSVLRLAIAYLIAVSLGWILAALLYRGKRAAVALPFFDVLQSFPAFAALPLAVVVWGATNFTVIFFLVIAVIWPIFFAIISSLKLIRSDWQEAVAVSGLSGSAYVRYFLWPVSLPGLITGSIVGLGDGWEALIATEIIVRIKTGVGSFFQSFANNPTMTFFGIFGFLLLIFSINKLVWLPLLEWSHQLLGD